MLKPTTFLRDIAAPSATALYERAMQDEKTYDELGNGTEIVPIFNPEITIEAVGGQQALLDKAGQVFGSKQSYVAESSFGIDYGAALYQPFGEAMHDFYIDIDTPVGTGIKGLNDEVAMRLVQEVGVPVILKGPEFSGGKKTGVRRLAEVALAAAQVSQSFSAESSMEITAAILEKHSEIARTAVVYGKSRGAMIGGKKYSYAAERDIDVVHYRLIDPCVGERALKSPADVVRFGLWPVSDMAQSLPSFARFALEGNLRDRAKTIELDASYLVGMIAGTIPSLLSGETMGSRIPRDRGVSLMQMGSNTIADTKAYAEQFSEHPNFNHHIVHDTHMGGIVLPRNAWRTVRHLRRFGDEFDAATGDISQIRWKVVHGNPAHAEVIPIHAA